MEIRKLDWDSYFFGFPVGYIFIDKEPSFNFSKILNSDIYTLIQIKSKQLINIISETHSLSYSEVKIIFSKNLSEISDIDIHIIDFDDDPVNENSLYSLAYEGGKYSRYKRDENFSDSMFKKFYQKTHLPPDFFPHDRRVFYQHRFSRFRQARFRESEPAHRSARRYICRSDNTDP